MQPNIALEPSALMTRLAPRLSAGVSLTQENHAENTQCRG